MERGELRTFSGCFKKSLAVSLNSRLLPSLNMTSEVKILGPSPSAPSSSGALPETDVLFAVPSPKISAATPYQSMIIIRQSPTEVLWELQVPIPVAPMLQLKALPLFSADELVTF